MTIFDECKSLKLDKTKIYTLRNGAEYKFYSDDNGGEYPIHGAMKVDAKYKHPVWAMITHTDKGKASASDWDIMLPKKHVLWLRSIETIMSEIEKNWYFDYNTDGSIDGVQFSGLYISIEWFERFDKAIDSIDKLPFHIRDDWVEKREVDDV